MNPLKEKNVKTLGHQPTSQLHQMAVLMRRCCIKIKRDTVSLAQQQRLIYKLKKKKIFLCFFVDPDSLENPRKHMHWYHAWLVVHQSW